MLIALLSGPAASFADEKAKPKRPREFWNPKGVHHTTVLSPPNGETIPMGLDLPLLISQLSNVEREPARELVHGFRLRYDAIVPNHLLIQVETRGVSTSRAQLDSMERMVREKKDRARQLAREQGGADVQISVWIDGKRSADLSDPTS